MKHYVFLICFAALLSACATRTDYAAMEPAAGDPNAVQPYRKPTGSSNRKMPSYKKRQQEFASAPAQNSGLMDPLKAHMMARKQVNPKDTSARRSYTQKTDPYVAGKSKPRRTASGSNRIVQRNIVTNAPIPADKPVTRVASIGTSSMALMQDGDAPVPARAPSRAQQNAPSPPPRMINTLSPTAQSLGHIRPPVKPGNTMQQPRPVLTRAAYSPPPSQNIPRIKNIRIGNHADKLRVVFDTTDNPSLKQVFNQSGTDVRAVFEQTDWDTQTQESYTNNPLLKSYRATQQGNDVIVDLAFKRPVRVSASTLYPPSNGKEMYRTIIDIVPR